MVTPALTIQSKGLAWNFLLLDYSRGSSDMNNYSKDVNQLRLLYIMYNL